ncbi:phage tail tape measure protein [Helicobacter sp. 12S02634-8]|uniref:phage tail tape measure protein n=1 Tax=Helicobacter sp. 12S02634-8 TaxID=1476199 RepID=UPI000BA52BBB|nr:phage tail tape measure protein [Helicobacter sp. 12S02634-8]PAF46287.1 phage tail tape measure protein [Helicobacter sp. 12S02634-8]
MNSSITLDIKANLEDLNKAISRVTKATKLDLGLNLKKSIEEATKGLRIGLKNNMPTAEINILKSKIKEATKIELDLKLDKATNQLKNLIPQALGTYATFKGLISAPVHTALDFNTAINEINKFSNFSHKELEGFKKDMFDLGKSNGMGLADILKISELSAQLGTPKAQLKGFTQNVIDFKIALGVSQDEAVGFTDALAKAFNLDNQGVKKLGDDLAFMAQSTGESAKEIMQVTNATLAGARAFGLSSKEALALSTAFLNTGLEVSEASGGINKFFTELNNIDNATDGFKQALGKLGIEAEILKEDMQASPQEAIKQLLYSIKDLDSSDQFGVISELFGKKMANNIHAAKDGVQAFEKALDSTKDSAGALQRAVDRAAGDGFGDSIFMLNASWTELKSTIGNIFIPVLKSLFDILREGLSWVSDFVKNSKITQWAILGSVSFLALGKTIGIVYTSWRAFGLLVFYPFQLLWKALEITRGGFALTTLFSKAFGFSLKALKIISTSLTLSFRLLSLSLKGIYSGFKIAVLGIFRFNYALAFQNTISKLTIAWNFALKASMFALNSSFKIASLGVGLFANVFKISMWSIKGALISTGIGALIVGLGVALSYVVSHWEEIEPKLIGIWENIKESLSPIFEWFKGIFDWFSNGFNSIFDSIGKLTDFLGLTSPQLTITPNTSPSPTLQAGLIDSTLANYNTNQQKILSQVANNDNSRQINDYKTITINTNAHPQAIASAINDYSYDDDF